MKRNKANTAKSKSHWAAWSRRPSLGGQVLMAVGQALQEGSAYPGAFMWTAGGLSAEVSWPGSTRLLSYKRATLVNTEPISPPGKGGAAFPAL